MDLQINELINTEWVSNYLIVDDVGNKISRDGDLIYENIKTTPISIFSSNLLTQETEDQSIPRFYGMIDCPTGFIFYFRSSYRVFYFFIENREYYNLTKNKIVKLLRKYVKDINNLLNQSQIKFNFSSITVKYISNIDLFILFTLDGHVTNIYSRYEKNSFLIERYIENAIRLINSVSDLQHARFNIESKSKLIHIEQLDTNYAVLALISEYEDSDEILEQVATFVTNLKIRLNTDNTKKL